MPVRTTFYTIFCIFAGGAISAGYVAFITLLGVFEKLAEKYKSNKYARVIETLIIIGVTLGNLIFLFEWKIHTGLIGLLIFNLLGGIFIGCLAGALAETLEVFPILSRRFKVRDYLPYVLIAGAVGKAIGCALQLIYFPQ